METSGVGFGPGSVKADEPPDAPDAASTNHLPEKDPADAEEDDSAEVEKVEGKPFVPSAFSWRCLPAPGDITTDEARDDAATVTERGDATVVSQATTLTMGTHNNVEAGDTSGMNSEVKEGRDGAEIDPLDVKISDEDGPVESTTNGLAPATTEDKETETASPETRPCSKTHSTYRSRFGKLRSSMSAMVRKRSLGPAGKKGTIPKGEALESEKSATNEQTEPANDETFTAAAEDKDVIIPDTVAEGDEEIIHPEAQSAFESHRSRLRSMPASPTSTVKRGTLTDAMHAKMAKTQLETTMTKAAFVDILNAKVRKSKMAEEGRKPQSEDAGELKPVLVQSAWSYDYFQVILSGDRKTDMMIRLPYNKNTTFGDLRRELEEDYAEDMPFPNFKFMVSREGMAVSSTQEKKWAVRDYDLTNQGGDGTYKDPYLVYIKEDGGMIKKYSGKKKERKTKGK
jgi:hypothetical protein